MIFKVKSNSPSVTKDIGKKLAGLLSGSDIILFSGELGGGKTTFITGVAEGLGIKNSLSSPSFTILNEYLLRNGNRLIHADFYRVDSLGELEATGLEDYIYNDNSIVCIEWGAGLSEVIKKDYLTIELEYLWGEENHLTDRMIIFKSSSYYWDGKIKSLREILLKAKICSRSCNQ